MKKVINKNRVRLVFPKYDLVMEPNEIKEITEDQFNGIIENISIEEVLHKSLKKEEKKDVEDENKKDTTHDEEFINSKGRKKKLLIIN